MHATHSRSGGSAPASLTRALAEAGLGFTDPRRQALNFSIFFLSLSDGYYLYYILYLKV